MAKRVSKKKKGLTPKQALFVKEYIVDFNATRAAKAAGYSPKTAFTIGVENLKKPLIQALLAKEIKKRADRIEITQDRVLTEYAKLAFLDPRKFYKKNGDLIPIHELPAEVAAALTGMDVQTIFTKDGDMMGDLKKIKFADKKPALDSVAKHLGMFIERHELTGKDGMALFPDLSDADLDARIAAILNTKASQAAGDNSE